MLSVSVVRDSDGEPSYFVSQIQDITERKHAEQDLRRQTEQLLTMAGQDPITGMCDRNAFMVRLVEEHERAGRYGRRTDGARGSAGGTPEGCVRPAATPSAMAGCARWPRSSVSSCGAPT